MTAGPVWDYPERDLFDLIATTATTHPTRVAVRQWDTELTYPDLVERSRAIAGALRAAGVRVEDRVAVCTRRRPHMVSAVLGTLAAGGAYVPVEPDAPPVRRDMLLADANVSVALVDAAGRDALADTGLTLVPVDTDAAPADPVLVRPDNAAYVLFTSGSTGRPKGVTVAHRSVVAFATATARQCRIGPDDVAVGFASLGFDVSVLDLFTALLTGGSVALVPEADRSDPARLQRFLAEHRVTWGVLPPALVPLLDPAGLPELTCLIVGGEATGPEQVARWATPRRRFLNWYGPTEATVSVTGVELDGTWDRPLPIGRPLPNHRCYVLDADGRRAPEGVLWVAGPGLARGYAGQPGATAAAFRPDPFAEVPGQRMYDTGDLVRWEPDGTLAYLGRADRQVQLAGVRVELGEVEAAISAHPDVAQVAVDAEGGTLTAYLAPTDAPDLAELRGYLAHRLPAAMIPTAVVRRDGLPLNRAGKTDLRALRATAAPTGPARRPGTDLADAVADAWAAALGGLVPAPDLDFFAAGGHSLAAMRLTATLRARLGVDVAVADVFTGRTVTGIARAIAGRPPAVVPDPSPGHRPDLSPAQRRLWFVDTLAESTRAYNIAVAQRLTGPLDVNALRGALGDVATRHEVLRWRVPDSDGVPRVEVTEPGEVPLSVRPVPADRLDRELRDAAVGRFDLATGPLWRAELLRLGADDHVLAITLHHIVFDGWSLDVLYRDISTAYEARLAGTVGFADRSRPHVGFADYSHWVGQIQDHRGEEALSWWLDRLATATGVLDLPRDHPRPATQTFSGADAAADLAPDLAAAVTDLAARCGLTPPAILLGAFALLVSRLTGQADPVIGVPAADRRHPDFDDLIGFCVDTLPVRPRVDDTAGFTEHVLACGDALIDAMEHRDVAYEKIVAGLGLPRDVSRNPLTQVLFNYYDFDQATLSLPGITARPLPPGLPGSLFDLTLYATRRADTFGLRVVYNPDLYDAGRITDLLASYQTLLADLLAHPDRPVGQATARPAGSALPDLTGPVPAAPVTVGLLERVDKAGASRPDQPAIVGPTRTLTYRDVADLRARVARAVGPDSGPVGVLTGRDVTLAPTLLGVLGTGARWLVLDATAPGAWTRRRVDAAGVTRLLVTPGVDVPADLADLPVIEVPDHAGRPEPPTRPPAERGYLMSTSGTTGEPAIVTVPEAPLDGFLGWYTDRFDIGPDDSTAMLAGLGHDPLLRDLFVPLVTGGTVRVPDDGWRHDPDRLLAFLRDTRVTICHLTPPLARMLTASAVTAPGVRLAVLAGDQLTDHDVAGVRARLPGAAIVNAYGTTETPQIQALGRIAPTNPGEREARPVPVGTAAPGTRLVVLTPAGKPAAVGELGELIVGGHGLATGYLDPDLTARRFHTTPRGERMYHTGDLARHDPDGSVVVAGRADERITIRGHRVEPGEVLAVLRGAPSVTAAALAVGDGPSLHAYVVGGRVDAVRAHLAASLPEHARPVTVTALPALPLTAHGKVDHAALPDPVEPTARPNAIPPATRTERLIAEVWREVLGPVPVSVDDNFFDVGGHSLAIVEVRARLVARSGRSVAVVDLFAHPTIRSLASHLDDTDGRARSPGLDRADRRIAARRARRTARAAHPRETP